MKSGPKRKAQTLLLISLQNLFRVTGFEESGPWRVNPIHYAQFGNLLCQFEMFVQSIVVFLFPSIDICLRHDALCQYFFRVDLINCTNRLISKVTYICLLR